VDLMVPAHKAESLERCAVYVTFWVGGVGLSIMKAVAYIATGSVLLRASMFESIGDVISSAIIFVTQRKVNDPRDLNRYPVGKARLVPLGVLFFCAFMCSTMSSMFIDALQSVLASAEPELAAEEVGFVLRRLFQEKPWLRWVYGTARVEALIAEYSRRVGASTDSSGGVRLSAMLLFLCVVFKLILYLSCRWVARLRGSEMVAALATDHRNDSAANSLVLLTSLFVTRLKETGSTAPWLDKADPAVTLLMSAWIVYGWLCNACEQLAALSDRRADDAEDVESVVSSAAQRALPEGGPLALQAARVYSAGEGCRVLLQLHPAANDAGAVRVTATLDALDSAVRNAQSGVQQVDAVLRSSEKIGG